VAGVFVNYRTDDEAGVAILLDRELSDWFGADRVFRAGRSIAPGDAWEPAILDAVRHSDVLIAVVGRRWLTALGRGGGRAVDDERDWTRREIVEAFAGGIPVIPVLVGTTARLTEADLPADLAPMVGCQYVRIDQHDVDAGIRRLLVTLQERMSGRSARPGPPRITDPGVSDWRRYPVGIDHERLMAADAVIDQIMTFLGRETTASAVTISGEGGLGKTAVTYEAVSTLTGGEGFTRIVWVSAKSGVFQTSDLVGERGTVDWHDVVRAIGQQLGCELSPSRRLWERDVGEHVRRLDGMDRILLVVDNLEGIDDAEQVIGRLGRLGIGRPHKLVATTRWAVTRNDGSSHRAGSRSRAVAGSDRPTGRLPLHLDTSTQVKALVVSHLQAEGPKRSHASRDRAVTGSGQVRRAPIRRRPAMQAVGRTVRPAGRSERCARR